MAGFPQGSGSTLQPWQFTPEKYGAVGNGIIDDTTAIRNAINAAVTYAQANNFYAEVIFGAKIYLANGTYVQGGATKGNAILPLPLIGTTVEKVTLALKGIHDATALPHWQQTVTQQSGAVIKTTRTDGQNESGGRNFNDTTTTLNSPVISSATAAFIAGDVNRVFVNANFATGTYVVSVQSGTQATMSTNATVSGTNVASTLDSFGESTILGGPNPAMGYGFSTVFSNMLLNIDGITFVAPANPTICGADARGLAEFNFGTLAFQADQNPGNATIPAHGWQFGAAMPASNNNDNCNGTWYSCEGAYFGILVAEHTCIQSIRCIYCADGIFFQSGTTFHGSWIGYASIEACAVCLNTSTSNSFSKVYIDNLDFENGAGGFAPQAHIYDPNNLMFGKVGLTTNNAISSLIITGAANLEIKSLQAGIGHVTPPAIPASTVALVNPFWRDAMVVITGGAVTVVTVDGTATGFTATGVTVVVPSGKTIALTFSVTPSWDWVLF